MRTKHRIGVAVLAIFGVTVMAVSAFAALNAYMTVSGHPGSVALPGKEETILITAMDHEVYRPLSAPGGTAGAKIHTPLTVLKQIDKSSPGLLKACANAENIESVRLDFYRPSGTGQEEQHYTITLQNASIISVKTIMANNVDPNYQGYQVMEEVKFIYQSIEWNWKPDSIVATDTWSREAPL